MNALSERIPLRLLTVIVFSLFFSWMLAFPFEGKILYALAAAYAIPTEKLVFTTVASQFAGLFLCGFFIKSPGNAKKLMLISIAYCIAATSVFLFNPSVLWNIALPTASFLSGSSVAAWGYFLKISTPKSKRIKTIADGLICSNILMIFLGMSALYLSPRTGLSLSIMVLAAAFYFTRMLPEENEKEPLQAARGKTDFPSITKPLTFLCIFIVIITIDSGLMYHVQVPAYSNLEWLTGWYWAVPYIVALFVMRNLPQKVNKTYLLYTALAMIGLSFIFFAFPNRSASGYLVVNTLMLGACGIFDLFWWSILGEMLDFGRCPSYVMGLGLSSNVLGVLLGGLIGDYIGDGPYSSLFALTVLCITLILLPPLHKYLSGLLKEHSYLVAFSKMPTEEKNTATGDIAQIGELSKREKELVQLLLRGLTYKAIAAELKVSENTVKTHIKNIYYKCKVNNRSELITKLLGQKNSKERT